MSIDWKALSDKWRERWERARVYEADPDPNKPKYFITVAYPYPNSPQHIGHGRTYTLADIHARYKRMLGYNVLLPMAFHYTGTPILAMAKRLASNDKELLDTFINIYKVPKEIIKEFNDPLKIAQYFHQEIKEGMKEMGYSIDWRREFTTIDPQYNRFIEWQFKKLREKGFIAQGSHPVGWCPKDNNPVGQHDTMGDVEPEIGEYTILKFLGDYYIIPTATLRPETIFGVTNIWINPDADYVEALIDNEVWIVSKEASEKLRYLNRKVEERRLLKGAELIGKNVTNPITGSKIPILPASFVNPKNGTGIVMSVPAHAPYDYQALEDLKTDYETLSRFNISLKSLEDLKPIVIIQSKDFEGIPACEIIKREGIKNQKDPKLEKVTQELYAHEFHLGRMLDNTMNYAGLTVSEARERVKEDLIKMNKADTMYEIMNQPVICRCGAECVVKIFENQWFLNYDNLEWKKLAHECLNQMSLLPDEIRSEFEYTINWLKKKACARKSGLGTKLPWDKDWVIESLSDSVIYMAYYILAKYINQNKITADQLTDEVFDYIFLGDKKGIHQISLDSSLLEAMRKEFTYFYPLDSRHSGRDLVPNHLTFFIFNHVAIFPKEYWPRQIVVNGSVLMEGKKMSKSFGNIVPLRDAVREYGTDPLRLAIIGTAELLADADFSFELVKTFRERLQRLYELAIELSQYPVKEVNESLLRVEDRWILSKLYRHIVNVTEAMDKLKVREALHCIIYLIDQDLRWYLRSTSTDSSPIRKAITNWILRKVLNVRVRMLAPFAPFICEEIWEILGEKGFVCQARWPKPEEGKLDLQAEEEEGFVMNLIEDTLNILKITKIKPKQIIFYTASEWKWKAYLKALEIVKKESLKMESLMNTLLQDVEMKKRAKELSRFIQKLIDNIATMPNEKRDIILQVGVINELKILESKIDFLAKEFSASIKVFNEDDVNKYDPKNRAHLAQPYRPAIYIE